MRDKLGLLVFIYYLLIKLCETETTSRNGFCIVHYTVQESGLETYRSSSPTWQKSYDRWGNTIWKYHPENLTLTRHVLKSVARTRIECCAGYENTTVHENIYSCEPICDPPCIEGHCSMPGNCTCFHGFEHQESNKCVPSCQPNCINSLCTSPGHCECMEGYNKVNSSYCDPHCSQDCKNGVCHKPEECLCNTGYKKNSVNPYECEPICDTACINATCTSYNECTCWNGFGKISGQDNACKPICELECLNGDCTAPSTCTCYEGYSKNDSINICQPDCADCGNGFCIKPNVCNCYENYTFNDEGRCEPICNNCTNGICIAPNECECIEGYQLDNDGKCIPYCDSCDNGDCIEPNVCSCFEGYESSKGSCSPICEYGCFAGECIAPNNCSCQEYDRVEENVCFPLQQDGTNSSENITPKRFQINTMKIPNSIDIYNLDLFNIYIKINCSYKITYNSSNDRERNSSNSIECSNIKNSFGLYVLCIWNRLWNNLDIQNLYTESLISIIYEVNETETESQYTKLGMTVLFPKDMMSDEEDCYLCPSLKHLRTKMPRNFSIPLIPCDLEQLHNAVTSFDWKGVEMMWLAISVTILLIIGGVAIFFRKHLKGDYFVHSSGQIDEIALSLNQED